MTGMELAPFVFSPILLGAKVQAPLPLRAESGKKRKERAPYRSCEDESGCAVVAVTRHNFYRTALLRLCPLCTKVSVESEHAGHSL